MKKSKYQQYFHCFTVYILGIHIHVDTQSGAYLRPGGYERKYGNTRSKIW